MYDQVQLEAEARKGLAEVRRQQAVVWRASMESDRAKQALHGAGTALELAQVQRETVRLSCDHITFSLMTTPYVRRLRRMYMD